MSMGFITSGNKENKKLQIPVDFRHALILGETGSGKTASVITPLLIDRIKRNHGIIIFDFKGNYHYTVKAIAKQFNKLQDVIELGKDYGKYVNLLKDLPIEVLDKILRNALGHDKEDRFWEESAIQLGISILAIIKYMNELLKDYKYSYSLKSLIEIASNAKMIKEFKEETIKYLNEVFSNAKDYSRKLNLIRIIAKYYQMLDKVADNDSLGRMIEDNEKTVLTSVIASLVNPIASLIKDNINTDEIDILDELEKRKIIIVSLNDFEENTLNTIVHSIFEKIHLFKMSYSDFPLTIIMDEAQKVLNNNFELPLDTLREYQVEVILATQSIANLKERLNSDKVEALLANLVHKVYLNGQDMQLPKFEAFYNNEYYKLSPIEAGNIMKFMAERKYQMLYSKLKDLPFSYKGKEVIYSKFDEFKLLVKDYNLKVIGKIDFMLKKYTKKELSEMFEFLTFKNSNEKAVETYLEIKDLIV